MPPHTQSSLPSAIAVPPGLAPTPLLGPRAWTWGDRTALLGQLKRALKASRARTLEIFRACAPWEESAALDCAQALSQTVDEVMRIALAAAERWHGAAVRELALVACGGYGRGELCPASDVDVMILLPEGRNTALAPAIEDLLYLLWDLGLTLGHAVRTPSECKAAARADQTVLTTLLEARLIAGNAPLFADFRALYSRRLQRGQAANFMRAKLAEIQRRHCAGDNGRYRVEPDLKDGRGGLRDLHTLCWLAAFVGGSDPHDPWPPLVAQGVVLADEAQQLIRARTLLLQARCGLHLLRGRDDNRLGFEMQKPLAELLGFHDDAVSLGVERVMRELFRAIRQVNHLMRVLIAVFEDLAGLTQGLDLSRLRAPGPRQLAGFILTRRRLAFGPQTDPAQQPLALLAIFRTALDLGVELHPSALRRIAELLDIVAPTLLEDPQAGPLLLEILMHRNDPEPMLQVMSECGVLPRLLPDFAPVVGLMQFDMYHYYTVDEHTLHAVGVMHQLEMGALGEVHALAAELMQEVQDRRLIYLAILLHDIAKGRGGDHSVLGEEVAHRLAPQLGLDEEASATVAWLVRHHLLLSHTALRRDLQDPQTISAFVSQVRDPEHLALLFILTVVDVTAVGPDRFTAWKGQLFASLYRAAERVFNGAEASMVPADISLERQRETRARLTHWTDEAFAAYAALGNNAFWTAFSPGQHAHLARLVDLAEREQRPLTVETMVRGEGLATDVIVHVADHPRLFAGITGALTAAGVNIVRAKVFTLGNGMALDVLSVQEDGHAVSDGARRSRLVALVRQVLQGDLALETALGRLKPHVSARRRAFQVPPQVRVDNAISRSWTVIEVQTTDQLGLLHRIARGLADQRLTVGLAKINTLGRRAVDVFYVKTMLGMQLEPERAEQVRQALETDLAAFEASRP